MATLHAEQWVLAEGLVKDLLLFKSCSNETGTPLRKPPPLCSSSPDFFPAYSLTTPSHLDPSSKERLKRKAAAAAEEKLCSLLLTLPPKSVIDANSSGFKRLKRTLQERVEWKKWLKDHREKWQSVRKAGTGEEGTIEARPSVGQEKAEDNHVLAAEPEAHAPVQLSDILHIDDPCCICSQRVDSFSEAIICDGCQQPRHLSCLRLTPDANAEATLVDGSLIPSVNPALAVESPETLPVRLLPTGEWFCHSCSAAGAKALYGRFRHKPPDTKSLKSLAIETSSDSLQQQQPGEQVAGSRAATVDQSNPVTGSRTALITDSEANEELTQESTKVEADGGAEQQTQEAIIPSVESSETQPPVNAEESQQAPPQAEPDTLEDSMQLP